MIKDRIRLAEAQGWTHIRMKWVQMEEKSYPFGCPPADQYSNKKVDKRFKEQIPDPFTSADDFVVLMDYIAETEDAGWTITRIEKGKWHAIVGHPFKEGFGATPQEAGTRAALKVINGSKQEKEQ